MALWLKWWSIVQLLRPAFSRNRTFLWFTAALAGMSLRSDQAGVTSFVRSLGLKPKHYHNLLGHFHSKGVQLDKLASLWAAIVLKIFPGVLRVKGRAVLVGDGIKIGKEGQRMPAVKSLHQESGSNTKPSYIMGHSCQVLGVLVSVAGYFFTVPIVSRIHEGLVFSNRDIRTLMDKMLAMISKLMMTTPVYLVLDAYYANSKMVFGLQHQGNQLLCRVRNNAVAHYPPPILDKRRRGRPQKYGNRVKLMNLFKSANFISAPSPVYGEKNIEILYLTVDLMWKPIGQLIRFILIKHPKRGKMILMTTDMQIHALEALELYGLRYKIEVSFKQAIHSIGTYAYHFWMRGMDKLKRGSGDQYLHRKNDEYRSDVTRKIHAFETHIQLGVIAQGMLQYLSMLAKEEIWSCFGTWLRTIRPDVLPSEQVVQTSLRKTFSDFLANSQDTCILTKFIAQRQVAVDQNSQNLQMTG